MTDWTSPDLGITADEFLTTLLGETRERPDETAMVAKRTEAWTDREGRPVKAGYHGYQWPGSAMKADRSHINIGLFRTVPLGERQRALLTEWTGMWALVLDDVLEKVPAPDIDPTCIIETKPGSQQWWFVFEEVVRNRFLAEQLVDGAIRAGITDPGANNIVRWVRLPGRKPADKKFDARVVEWNPDLRFEPEALAAALGMELREWDHWNGEGSGFDIRTMGKAIDDPLLAWMDEAGMVTSRSGRDWVAIPCPRGDAHSNDDPDAYYLPARENGGRIFFCQHGHMHDGGKPTQDEFEEFLLDSGCPPELLRKSRDLDELAEYLLKAVKMVKDAEAQNMSALERRRLRQEQKAKEEAFLQQQEDTNKVLNAPKLTKAQKEAQAVEKAAKAAAAEDVADAGAQLDEDIPNVFDWTYVRAGFFVHRTTGETITRGAFDVAMRRGAKVMDETKFIQLNPTEYYIDMGGVTYADVMYRPDVPPGETVMYKGLDYFNTYDGQHTTPTPGPGGELCRAHLQNLFPRDWRIIEQWLAHVVQNPGEKIKWCLTLLGEEGDGKNTIAAMLQAALGPRHVGVVSTSELQETFTEWAQGVTVSVLEEVYIPGKKREEVMNKLKPFITDVDGRCSRKGKPGLSFVNCTSYLALTNHEDALAPATKDRRYGIYRTRFKDEDSHLNVEDELPQAYFDALYDVIRNRPGEIAAWLHSVDTATLPLKRAPSSEAKADMISATRPVIWQQVEEALLMDAPGIYPTVLILGKLRDVIMGDKIRGKRVENTALAKVLHQMGWRRADAPQGRMKYNGEPVVVYYRPEGGLTGDPAVLRTALDWQAQLQAKRSQEGAKLDADLLAPKR